MRCLHSAQRDRARSACLGWGCVAPVHVVFEAAGSAIQIGETVHALPAAVNCVQACPKETVPNGRTTAAVRSQLLSFHAHVDELSNVLVKADDWHLLRDRGGGVKVDRVSLRLLITVQSVEMECRLPDLDAMTGDPASERGGNVGGGCL